MSLWLSSSAGQLTAAVDFLEVPLVAKTLQLVVSKSQAVLECVENEQVGEMFSSQEISTLCYQSPIHKNILHP